MGERLRFGGTMELSGHSGNVRPERVDQIRNAAQTYFPGFRPDDFAGVQPWFGYRPVSPDGMAYIGRLARYTNLSAACGHAMLGVTLAPITGVVIAETLSGRKPSVDMTLLNPDRFA
ncbi:MAG: FAD-dependent oxidoreductase [Chthoniobacterales bacterium]|nr:FAD-dependent oxidoreductase [Chthoniobacterales bacterium]